MTWTDENTDPVLRRLQRHLADHEQRLRDEGTTVRSVAVTLSGAAAAQHSDADLQDYLRWRLQLGTLTEVDLAVDISAVQVVDARIQPSIDPLDWPDRIEAGAFDDLLVNIETACRNRRTALEAAGKEIPWE